jgi:IS1 family transposase
LYAVLRAVKDGEMSEEEAIQRLSRSPHWVWTAIDPQSKLLLAIDVGPHTRAMAQRVVHQMMEGLAPGCVPLCVTDGFKEYATALLTHFGQWVQPPPRQDKGPHPKPRWMPLPQLLYAQVVKTVRRRCLVRVNHRVVFGTFEAVQQVLAACGWQINTAFVERLNLNRRQHVAAVGRRVSTLCKGGDGIGQQLALYHAYYNFCLPHASLRQPLPEPRADPRQWLGEGVAAVYTRNGGRIDRSCVDASGGAVVPCAAVAPAPGVLSGGGTGGSWDDAGEVCLWTGTDRFTRGWNPDVRGNDWLLYASQTAWERSRNIIRNAEAHDLHDEHGRPGRNVKGSGE